MYFYSVRETSFLTESVDIVPDENSRVLKHDPNCAIGSQVSVPSEDSHNKPNESILQSQDVIRCFSPSLTDPLCSFVPITILILIKEMILRILSHPSLDLRWIIFKGYWKRMLILTVVMRKLCPC